MIISHSQKFVFIHNPKVAGTSLRNALSKWDDTKNAFWGPYYHPILGRKIDLAHVMIRDLAVFPELRGSMEDYFTFGIVRDPIERFHSAVSYYNKRKPDRARKAHEFLELFIKYPTLMTYDIDFVHFCPQHEFFYYQSEQGLKCLADVLLPLERLNRLPNLLKLPFMIGQDNVSDGSRGHKDGAVDEQIGILYEQDYRLMGHLF